MEIIKGVPFGAAEDQRADPENLGLVDEQPGLTRDRSQLRLLVAHCAPGVSVVRVAGELDMLTAPLLDRCLETQLAGGPAHLVVDLEAVEFMGSRALTTLITARELAQTAGAVLHLTGMTTRAVARPLVVTGLLSLFNL